MFTGQNGRIRLCVACVAVHVLINRIGRTSPGNHTRQNLEMFFSHLPGWGTRNNDVTPNCATITTTNVADIYTDAHAHFPNNGNCIWLLVMEHMDSACSEKCSWTSRTLIEFPHVASLAWSRSFAAAKDARQ